MNRGLSLVFNSSARNVTKMGNDSPFQCPPYIILTEEKSEPEAVTSQF
jgi:hypothetical protein